MALARSKDEFVERFKRHVAGMALFGVASEIKDGPLARAGKVLEIPGEVERLLGQMYDYVAEAQKNAERHNPPPGNGGGSTKGESTDGRQQQGNQAGAAGSNNARRPAGGGQAQGAQEGSANRRPVAPGDGQGGRAAG